MKSGTGLSRVEDLAGSLPQLRTKLNLKVYLDLVRPGLEEVDRCIRHQVEAFDPGIVNYVEYAAESSGKRIRPALALLAAGATGVRHPDHVSLAVVVELIHLASLIHDDILDNAEIRRARPTVFSKWGADLSVLLGDCLFAHALRLCAALPVREVNRLIADAAYEVCAGEILQMQRRFDWKLAQADYLRIIGMKTGALFRVACEAAAGLNQAPAHYGEALRTYGDHLGVAYQIYDDCLDLFGTEEHSGKTLGTDLKKGKLTLPLIYLLEQLGPAELAEVSETILHGDEEDRLGLLRQVIEAGGVRFSLSKANELLDRAGQSLEVLPEGPARSSLASLPKALAEHLATLKT
ncbi:MAG: polyprenyl synthetase family protein [Verrucomicrobiia bacterium]